MKNKLVIAVMYSDRGIYDKAKSMLVDRFRKIEKEGSEYDFDRFTSYYEKEMGRNLVKRFLIFDYNLDKEDLIRIKKETTEIENRFAVDGNRTINLDPGYVDKDGLVLASFKKGTNYKENLGEGVYAHKVLGFKEGETEVFWHTFPDYRVKENQRFFREK